MSDRSSTTLGYEWSTNPYLKAVANKDEFVSFLLDSQPPAPPYYGRMKKLNAEGHVFLNGLPGQYALDLDAFRALVDSGATVIDLRDQLAFAAGHIPSSFGIGATGNLSAWASWVVPYDTPIVLVSSQSDADRMMDELDWATRALVRVGLDDVRGCLVSGSSVAGSIGNWREAGLPLASFGTRQPRDAARELAEHRLALYDVRNATEWQAGHIDGATWCPLGRLAEHLTTTPVTDTEVATLCKTGYRSTIAACLFERAGFSNISNLTGGWTAYSKARR